MQPLWYRWLAQQSREERDRILFKLVEYLIDNRTISFRIDDIVDLEGNLIPENEEMDEFLYWTKTLEKV